MIFTDAELEYLRSQRLGRLATKRPDGTLQNNPVGVRVDEEAGVIDIHGRDLGADGTESSTRSISPPAGGS